MDKLLYFLIKLVNGKTVRHIVVWPPVLFSLVTTVYHHNKMTRKSLKVIVMFIPTGMFTSVMLVNALFNMYDNVIRIPCGNSNTASQEKSIFGFM